MGHSTLDSIQTISILSSLGLLTGESFLLCCHWRAFYYIHPSPTKASMPVGKGDWGNILEDIAEMSEPSDREDQQADSPVSTSILCCEYATFLHVRFTDAGPADLDGRSTTTIYANHLGLGRRTIRHHNQRQIRAKVEQLQPKMSRTATALMTPIYSSAIQKRESIGPRRTKRINSIIPPLEIWPTKKHCRQTWMPFQKSFRRTLKCR